MSEIMQARAVMAKKLNVMVRKIDGITAFLLTGNDKYTPDEIFFVVASSDDSSLSKVLADLDFLIRQFLRPFDIQKTESDGRTLVNYLFDNGLKAQVNICAEDNLPSFSWWVPYMDKNNAARGFYPSESRYTSDPTTEKPEPDDGIADNSNDDSPTKRKEPSVPAAEHADAGPRADFRSEKELWDYFYGKINVAKHAISGGSVIYANETIGELRTLLIKMICEANGVTENYMHSIDLLPENHRAALMKTYPARPDGSAMIAALAAELSIFEELMKRMSR